MTHYSSWKKREVQRKWQSILGIFITFILLFAIINGFLKTVSIGKFLGKSKWDGKGSFVLSLKTNPQSVFIFQKDPKRLVFLTISPDIYLENNGSKTPLVKLSQIDSAEESAKLLSNSFGAKIDQFVTFQKDQVLDKAGARGIFKQFASITFPFNIISGIANIKSTNVTRVDWFRLWWQIKGLSVDKLEIVDISPKTEDIVTSSNQKILGADSASWHRVISEYLENQELSREDFKIEITNSSGERGAGKLASDFVTSVGGKVTNVESSDNYTEKTMIFTDNKNSSTALYLAKIFQCDINGQGKVEDEGKIIIVLGRDFAARNLK